MSRKIAGKHRTSGSIGRAGSIFALILVGVVSSSGAHAGVYTDDLAKCLVKSSDSNDRIALVQWMFAALALHPAVKPFASVSVEQRDAATKKAASIFIRLFAENCRKEAVDAIKYEGTATISASFQVLGQVASRDLMTEPHVSKGMSELGADLNGDERLKALLKDAGVTQK